MNTDLVGFVQNNRVERTATLVETEKGSALWCYEGYAAYQPINTWWAEQGLVVHTEFRDGNVPAGFEQKRVLEEALESLPKRVTKVRMRSDTRGWFYRDEGVVCCRGVTVFDQKDRGKVNQKDGRWAPMRGPALTR